MSSSEAGSREAHGPAPEDTAWAAPGISRLGITRLLDEAPDLGSGLCAQDFHVARESLTAPVYGVARGVHELGASGDPRWLGLLLLDGLLIRRVAFAEQHAAELLGPGSLLRPWSRPDEYAVMPYTVGWRVVEPLRIAVVDRRLARLASAWPALTTTVLDRLAERSDLLAANAALQAVRHLDVRLLILFWHLADRFGHVSGEGTVVPLRLNHADLADLLVNRRPSISMALSSLKRSGLLVRRTDRSWLLTGPAPACAGDLTSEMYQKLGLPELP